MKQPRQWRRVQRHPESAAYADITGREWEDYLANLRVNGIENGRKVMIFEGKVADGWQLYRACIACNVKPTFAAVVLKKGQTINEWVATVNDRRRHESPEQLMHRAEMRRERVAAARAEGQSTRTIAEAEGVSQQTVLRDLEQATDTGVSVEPQGGKVIGKDGKERPAHQDPIIPALREIIDAGKISPKLVPQVAQLTKNQQGVMLEEIGREVNPRQALNKAQEPETDEPGHDRHRRKPSTNGKIAFDRKAFAAAYAALFRQIDDIGRPYQAKNTPEAEGLRNLLKEWRVQFDDWATTLIKKGTI